MLGFGIRDWGVIARILEIVHLPHFVRILVVSPAFCIQYSGDGVVKMVMSRYKIMVRLRMDFQYAGYRLGLYKA